MRTVAHGAGYAENATWREDEDSRVYHWREWRFLQMGCTTEAAAENAGKAWHELDLHDFEALVDAGCPPDTAALILL